MRLLSLAGLTSMFGFVVVAVGCASSNANVPAGATGHARVVVVYDEDILLTGTTDGQKVETAKACAPAEPKHVVELPEPSKAKVTLRATEGATPLAGATLRVTNLATKQTWCATMSDDQRATLVPPEQLPSGLYAVSVVEERSEPHRYEILWQQM
jgi:hypothetical protein